MLELQYLIVLQHARLEIADAGLELAHGQFDLPGLEVGDMDFAVAFGLGSSDASMSGTDAWKSARQSRFAVGKRRTR